MKMQIAILDDYQEIAMKLADRSSIPGRPEIKVFTDHVFDLETLAQRLFPRTSRAGYSTAKGEI
jgi:hypothetical protein